MSYIELLLIGIGLCFDTFAVSLTGGVCMKTKPNVWQTIRIFTVFALFQAGFTLLGWLLGIELYFYIEKVDHWIAFTLLAYIGTTMIIEGSKGDGAKECPLNKGGKPKNDLLNIRQLVVLAIATSIDALAVGISLAMVSLSAAKIIVGIASVFTFTALAALIGLKGGRSLGDKLGSKPELMGGVILIAIGLKILIEHIAF